MLLRNANIPDKKNAIQRGTVVSTFDPLETFSCFCLSWLFPFYHSWVPR